MFFSSISIFFYRFALPYFWSLQSAIFDRHYIEFHYVEFSTNIHFFSFDSQANV